MAQIARVPFGCHLCHAVNLYENHVIFLYFNVMPKQILVLSYCILLCLLPNLLVAYVL